MGEVVIEAVVEVEVEMTVVIVFCLVVPPGDDVTVTVK